MSFSYVLLSQISSERGLLMTGLEKRKAAEKAEADFFMLLKEKVEITETSSWKDAKRGLDKDPRYDAVGSSSLREELFNTYVKTLSGGVRPSGISSKPETSEESEADRVRKNRERKERAVKERGEQVRRERERVEVEMARSRNVLTREESESEFMCAIPQLLFRPLFGLSALTSFSLASLQDLIDRCYPGTFGMAVLDLRTVT